MFFRQVGLRQYKNYLKTIAKPVPLSLLYEELPREVVDRMRERTDDKIFAWGATRKGRNPKIWSQMRAGENNLPILHLLRDE